MDIIFRDVDPAIAALIFQAFSLHESLPVPEIQATDYVWTPDTAERLLRDVRQRQRELLIKTARAGGRLAARELRGEDNSTLKGLTGPITKAANRMIRDGLIPEGTPAPVFVLRDPERRAWERADPFGMTPENAAAFRAAAGRLPD